jgi:2-polyprenyl-6-methoxyphenol hydroxylase-like FAD-dependent oxidoreductase
MLVVGAGIGGLTLVRAMRSTDWAVDLVEQAPRFHPLGVGIVLQPNGVRALAHLGLFGEVAAAGNQVHYLDIVRGSAHRRLSLAEVWAGVDFPTISVLRSDLHQILLRAATSTPTPTSTPTGKLAVRLGAGLVRVERPDARPIAHFTDGSAAEYDVVVGADGVHSTLRRALAPGAVAVSTGLYYVRFQSSGISGQRDSASDTDSRPADTWRTIETADASYGYIPLGTDRWHCFLQLRTGAESVERDHVDPARLRAFLAGQDADLAEAFDLRIGAPHCGYAHLVRPISWGRGACALMGDAAHAVSPTLSEGGSLAIEDAVVLAASLDGVAVDEGLAAYRHARHPIVAWAYRMSLAQVNSARRAREPVWAIDTQSATTHLRQMYEPLRAEPVGQAPLGERPSRAISSSS